MALSRFLRVFCLPCGRRRRERVRHAPPTSTPNSSYAKLWEFKSVSDSGMDFLVAREAQAAKASCFSKRLKADHEENLPVRAASAERGNCVGGEGEGGIVCGPGSDVGEHMDDCTCRICNWCRVAAVTVAGSISSDNIDSDCSACSGSVFFTSDELLRARCRFLKRKCSDALNLGLPKKRKFDY